MAALFDAIRQAERRAQEERQPITVYHLAGPDQWGRVGVVYVRSEAEGTPGGAVETVYVAYPKEA